ncbi:hypothetical protein GIB67_018953 [Kingdonia uniflora]|nr:hypothetical protein GIB67_018953 [Kingdonia uniflora]
MEDETETFHSPNIALSPKTQPIPIVYGPKFRHPIVEKDEMEELSESYTCVISKFGKREYFDDEPHEKSEGMFLVSPVKWNIEEGATMFQAKDFLSFCYLCNKHLHGLDIFMYRGDKAFCSAECRSRQIMVDDHKEKYGNGVLVKSLDYSVSPCSAPVFFPAGVAAA